MGRNTLTREAYLSVHDEVKKDRGRTTERAEQKIRRGEGLDPLVDPKGFGVIRRSLTRMEEVEGHFVSTMGLPMLVEVRFDTTSSMGGNVDLAFQALPRTYDLLFGRPEAVLSRYDLQIINSIFNDKDDPVVLCRSQAEMGIKIAEQLRMMVPVRAGGDTAEDPQYGIFGGAYLVRSNARLFGLGTYDFTITDAPGRLEIKEHLLKSIFGDDVIDKVNENGFQMKSGKIPSTKQVVKDLLVNAHAFVLLVDDVDDYTKQFWRDIYGKERVVILPRTELVPEVQAAIIGLTEGRLDLQNLEAYLMKAAQLSASDAREIKRAVAGIPIGAQMLRPNFNKVYEAGAKFAKKSDIFPIGFNGESDSSENRPKPKKKPDMWM